MKLPIKKQDNVRRLDTKVNLDLLYRGKESKYSTKSDREIWSEFKNGDEEAFNHIYRKNTERLFNYAYQYIKNKELIKDCIQNLYIELRNNRKKLPEVTSIKAYLYKAIYWKVKRKLEAEKKFISASELPDSIFRVELSFEEKVIDQELDKEIKIRLQNLLSVLTPKQRKALILFYKEDMSYIELAEVMGLKNSKSARKLIYRALFAARKENKHLEGIFNSFLSLIMVCEVVKSINI
ncbi:MAG: sigma-70 family RNA polymerase sigma factor [Bacteroidota bacterium]